MCKFIFCKKVNHVHSRIIESDKIRNKRKYLLKIDKEICSEGLLIEIAKK